VGRPIAHAWVMTGLAALIMVTAHAASAASTGECHGVLHLDHGSIQIGGGAGEGEAICLVARSERAKVLKGCSAGMFCRVGGARNACKDSGECVEISRIEWVRKH
jgi:hypothetical protein